MASGLGLGDRRWGLSFSSPESWESTNHCREQDRGEPLGGLVTALCLVTRDIQALEPHPERGLVWQKKGRLHLWEKVV